MVSFVVFYQSTRFCSFHSWWRHQMETFSALLAICAGKSPVPGEFPARRPVTRSFDVFFDLRLNKRLSKQSWGWWFETLLRPLWRQCNAPIVQYYFTGLGAISTTDDHWSYHCPSTNELKLAKIGVLITPITGAVNLLKVIQNGCYFVDNIFVFILKRKLLNFYSNLTTIGPQGPVNNSPAQIEIMVWCRTGKKPISETNDRLLYWRTSYGRHSMISTAYDNQGESKPWCYISMAQCKAAVTSLLTHGSHCSLALSHRYNRYAIIEIRELSWYRLYGHWLHRRLSLWQQPVTTKLTSWQFSGFSDVAIDMLLLLESNSEVMTPKVR